MRATGRQEGGDGERGEGRSVHEGVSCRGVRARSSTRHATHPNAARLLIDFLTSEEGQQVFRQADYLPALPQVPTMTPGLRPADGKFEATYLRPAAVDRNVARWAKVVEELFR